MHHATQHYAHRIGKDVFPAPVVIRLVMVVHLFDYG